MNRVLYLVLLFATMASTSLAFADEGDYGCKGKDTSSFFDACVNLKQAEEWEKEINQSLKMVAALASSKQGEKNLVDSQVAWKKYRDSSLRLRSGQAFPLRFARNDASKKGFARISKGRLLHVSGARPFDFAQGRLGRP